MKYLIFWAVLLLAGCGSMPHGLDDVSADARIKHHIGREFVLKEDLYLYLRKQMQLNAPLLGPSTAGPLGLGQPRLPAPVSTNRIGYEDPQIKIVGVLAKGAHVRIERVLYLHGPVSDFIILMLSTSDSKNPRAEYHITGDPDVARTKDFSQAPWFFDYYAEEVFGGK
jgi:hypothetical protein